MYYTLEPFQILSHNFGEKIWNGKPGFKAMCIMCVYSISRGFLRAVYHVFSFSSASEGARDSNKLTLSDLKDLFAIQ